MSKSFALIFALVFIFPCQHFGNTNAIDSDTDPPVITTLPNDLIVPCGVDYITPFTIWINEQGGMEAEDEGEINYFDTFGSGILLDSIQASSDTLCGNTAIIPIGFYAIDDCNNISDTVYVDFIVQDIEPPTIDVGPLNMTMECNEAASDSLQSWLDRIGNAESSDACGGEATWNNYTWEDIDGNQGFADIGAPTDIVISPDACEWRVDVTFFVLDECGNANLTMARFSLTDTTIPVVEAMITDTSITCLDTIPELAPIFIDECSGPLDPEFSSTNEQGTDPNECSFYNYSIITNYVATDACGNSVTFDQTIQVMDTMAPIIIASSTISLDCSVDLDDQSFFIDSLIDCSPVSSNYKDSIIGVDECNFEFLRSWNFEDVCGNLVEFNQEVSVIDQTGPEIISEIPSLELSCDRLSQIPDIFENFFDTIKDLEISDNCSEGRVSISNNEIDEGFDIDFVYVPNLSCDQDQNLQQESIALNVFDDCGNLELASSNFLVVDSIAPVILNCPGEEILQLESGECSLDIILDTLQLEEACEQIESFYYFKKEANLIDIDSSNLSPINFGWTFESNIDAKLTGDGTLSLRLQGIKSATDRLSFTLLHGNGETILEYNQPKEDCETFDLSFPIQENIVQSWIDEEEIEINLSFDIDQLADCQVALVAGISLEAPIEIEAKQQHYYQLDGGEETAFEHGDILSIESGLHNLNYIVEDCSGNRSSCTQAFDIIDTELPEITCPDNITIDLPLDTCVATFDFAPDFEFTENCQTEFTSLFELPEGNDRFISFSENSSGDIVANNIQLSYTDLALNELLLNPTLIIEMLANTSGDQAFFSILDENGNELATTIQGEESCVSPLIFEIPLSLSDLEAWAMDGTIDFNFVTEDQEAGGIGPCDPDNYDGDIDQSSFLTATLAFTEVIPNVTITDLADNSTVEFNDDGSLSLVQGEYIIDLSTADNSGNIAECSYRITVLDNSDPQLICSDSNIDIGIEIQGGIVPLVDMVDYTLTENCGISELILNAGEVDCRNIGESIMATLSTTDINGNQTNCDFNFIVRALDLNPGFSSSLCIGESITLLNNIELEQPETILYSWTGPENFVSSEANPEIENATALNSGIYVLEATNALGCVFTGEVQVMIESLDSPQISSPSEDVCEGESFILNSNSFSDDVTYLWYEGVSPSGILIGETDGPSIEITTAIGTHFYYGIVDGNGCQSNPSNTFMIEVIENPTALVESNFITVCEGSELILKTENINPTLEFIWSGPNGYVSNEGNPPPIENVNTDNQGTYQLIVIDKGCESVPVPVEVIVFSQPLQPIITGDNILCQGAPFNLFVLNNSSAEKYNWYLNGSLYNTTNTNNLFVPVSQSALGGNWTVVLEDDGCESEFSDTFVVEIEDQITVGAGNNGPTCEGSNVTLTASFVPDASYVWTTPNSQMFFDRIVTVPAVAGLYTVSVSTPSGCEGSASTTVEIIQVPEITALSNSSTACMDFGDEIGFTPSVFPPGLYAYIWSGPNAFTSPDANPTLNYQGPTSNGTYSLQVQNGVCLSEVATTEISSNLIPQQPIIENPGPLCEGEAITIQAQNISNLVSSYIWNTPLGQIVTSETTLNISSSTSMNQGTYSLIVESDGCFSIASEPFELIIQSSIAAPIISGPSDLCAGQELVLEISNPVTDANYTWILPDGSTVEGETLVIDNFTFADAGFYSVTSELSGCSFDLGMPFEVTLGNGPEAPLLNIDEFVFCQNDLMQVDLLDLIITNGSDEYVLYDPSGNPIASTSTADFQEIDLGGYDVGINEFTVVSSVSDCESEVGTSLSIEILATPLMANFDVDFLEFCETNIQQVVIENPDALELSIAVEGENVTILNEATNSILINIFDQGASTVLLFSSDATCGSIGIDSLEIILLDTIIAADDFLDIEDAEATEINVLSNDSFSGDVTIEITSEITGPDIEVEGTNIVATANGFVGEYSFEYTVCSIACPDVCSQAMVQINFLEDDTNTSCLPANVITANGDGVNDLFEFPCLDIGEVIQLEIFNQNGQSVFFSDDYQNDWDGNFDGQPLASGTYYYVYQKSNESPENGFIIIER